MYTNNNIVKPNIIFLFLFVKIIIISKNKDKYGNNLNLKFVLSFFISKTDKITAIPISKPNSFLTGIKYICSILKPPI